MSDYNTKDALGNDIVIGAKYGFSRDSSGVTEVTTGKAIGFTTKGLLTIEVLTRKAGYGNSELKPDSWKKQEKCSVKPSKLFPLNGDMLDSYRNVIGGGYLQFLVDRSKSNFTMLAVNYSENLDLLKKIDPVLCRQMDYLKKEWEDKL